MTDHDHDHDHHHALDWQAALEQLRDAARHYYEHQFDWRGHGPPEGFDGPRWFAPAPEWRLAAHLDRDVPGAGDQVELATSTGQLRHMSIAGQLVFQVGAAEHRLTAFLSSTADKLETLFVPFRDATSGYAYNPSCAFSPAYDCPFPPPGNRLSVAVTAGEMLPSGGAPH